MNVLFDNISIKGIAAALPSDQFDLLRLSDEYGENEVKRIIASTGIRSIRVANKNINTSDFCKSAAMTLLNEMNISAATIDAIVFVSQTPDAIMPATSVMLQHRLGISTNAVAFDISYGCSGYIYGLYQAAMLLVAGGCHRVLLCAGDVITPLLHPGDRHVRMVFGDAGSATLIESGNDKIAFSLKTDGSGMNDLHCDKYNIDTNEKQYLFMDGAAIMSFALREVPLIVDDLLKLKQWHANEVGTFALHQANAFMINYLRKKMKITKEAVPITMESTGNTGSASIPLSLTLSHQRLCQENRLDKVVMCGFGVGYSMGAAGVNLSKTIITPPVQYKH